ncbi:MAG: hypothetical protein PF961_19110, partial [Planctomycetota bacterium]|nr:hypothetical protein [Planctomycetota bacterium]
RSPSVAQGGWRWGGRGGVTSLAVEKPHFSAWRPILQTGFDLAYSPLLELPVGKGRLLLCTLDLHDHARQDPAAERLVHAVVATLASSPGTFAAERPARTLVDAVWQQRLVQAGIEAEAGLSQLADDSVVVIGRELEPTEQASITAHVMAGGRALVLPDAPIPADWGFERNPVEHIEVGLAPPHLPALRGLDIADLRIRATHPGVVIAGNGAVDAAGQYAERALGAGKIAVIGFDPWQFDTEAHPYLRFTAWRQARAFAQVCANHGIRPVHDQRVFTPLSAKAHQSLAGEWRAYATALQQSTRQEIADPGLSAAAQTLIAGSSKLESENVTLPAEWESFGGAWSNADGEAVFERTVTIPSDWRGQDLLLSLGVLDDFDRVYIDGVELGHTDSSTPRWWTLLRQYVIPADRIRQQDVRLTVRIFDHAGGGGFMARDAADMFVVPVVLDRERRAALAQPGPYHPDYIDDFATGDYPYRYYNW